MIEIILLILCLINFAFSVLLFTKMANRASAPSIRRWAFGDDKPKQSGQLIDNGAIVIETNKDHYAAMRGDVDDWN